MDMKMALPNAYRAIDTHMTKPTNVETNNRKESHKWNPNLPIECRGMMKVLSKKRKRIINNEGSKTTTLHEILMHIIRFLFYCHTCIILCFAKQHG